MDSFDKIYQLLLENLILERNALPYAASIDVSAVQSDLIKDAHKPYVSKFRDEVLNAWGTYHLLPRFDMINRVKASQRLMSFEYGTRADGFRGIGYQQGPAFFVTHLFSNHRDYDKFVKRL